MMNKISTKMSRRSLLTSTLVTSIASAWHVSSALAAEWPDKTLRMFVGYPAGSGIDSVARQLARQLEVSTGQAVIVENRPGALGNIAAQAVAAAYGDPNTLLFTPNSTHAANIHLFRKLPFDPVKDFTPVASVATLNFVLVCDPKAIDATNVNQLIQAIKREPGRWAYGTGNATGMVAGAMFKSQAGVDLIGAPYKGVPQAMTDLFGGRIQLVFADATLAIPLVRAGKLRALAVTGQRRMAALAQVPTMAESGLSGFSLSSWFAVFQSAGIPMKNNERMSALVQRAVREPSMAEFLRNIGAEPEPSTPDELARRVNEDTERWGRMVKLAGIEPE
jgi:tripartite-type tricarboxylate transporter receptor subunit TctC